MPYHVVLGIDRKGHYARSSERLHSKKYYYKTEIGKNLAINKAKKQILAVTLSEIRRGTFKR